MLEWMGYWWRMGRKDASRGVEQLNERTEGGRGLILLAAMRCDAMQVCDSSTFLHPRGVPSGVKPVFAQSACVYVYTCLCVFFFSLTVQEQSSPALHMQPFIQVPSLRPLKEEGCIYEAISMHTDLIRGRQFHWKGSIDL